MDGARLVVVGAGFIGSEVAATCRGLGAHVTVVEALPQPLARVLGAEMGAACGALHADHGVELRTGVGVVARTPAPKPAPALHGSNAATVGGVELDDGTVVDADVVVVGIGVVPTTAWLADPRGSSCLTAWSPTPRCTPADDIVVAGDVARWFDEGLGSHIRIEHWTNAAEQGVAAARSLLAGAADASAYVPVPYFWSDQYDVKIQVIGHPDPDDDVVVVDGSVEERRFVALYGRAGRFVAALGFGRPRQLMGVPPAARGGGELRRGAGPPIGLTATRPRRHAARGSSRLRGRARIDGRRSCRLGVVGLASPVGARLDHDGQRPPASRRVAGQPRRARRRTRRASRPRTAAARRGARRARCGAPPARPTWRAGYDGVSARRPRR